MLEGYKKTLKSRETEDWLDYHFVRPLSYLWALLFARLGVHPNAVTIASMFIGAGSAFLFASGCWYYNGMEGLWLNVAAILLLLWADVFDCTDGQLARMTGKKSKLGRILDGTAGFVWFVPIYLALDWRFYCHHSIEFSALGIADTETNTLVATAVVFVLSLVSGFMGMGGQQRLADYYIQAHLFFLKGHEGSELDNSAQQQAALDATPKSERLWRMFLSSYVGYTQKQERATPCFQRLLGTLRERFGSASAGLKACPEVREQLHQESRRLMFWNGLLTFNFRSGAFFLFCLLDVPALNFVFEIVGMGLLTAYVNRRHERMCRRAELRIKN